MYRLRELERKDLNIINKWRNDAELIEKLGAPFRFINLDVDVSWYENYMHNRGKVIRCAIVSVDDDEILGLISLTTIDSINQSAELHIMIGNKKNQNQGIGSFAINKMLQHAFFNMNLHRVELTVLSDNDRARHVYEKCGFKKEGIKRKSNFKNGVFVDTYFYAILKEDFLVNADKMSTWGGHRYSYYYTKHSEAA